MQVNWRELFLDILTQKTDPDLSYFDTSGLFGPNQVRHKSPFSGLMRFEAPTSYLLAWLLLVFQTSGALVNQASAGADVSLSWV